MAPHARAEKAVDAELKPGGAEGGRHVAALRLGEYDRILDRKTPAVNRDSLIRTSEHAPERSQVEINRGNIERSRIESEQARKVDVSAGAGVEYQKGSVVCERNSGCGRIDEVPGILRQEAQLDIVGCAPGRTVVPHRERKPVDRREHISLHDQLAEGNSSEIIFKEGQVLFDVRPVVRRRG